MTSPLRTLWSLLTLLPSLHSALRGGPLARAGEARVDELLEGAAAARAAGRSDEARSLFEQVLTAHPGPAGRLAIVHYELGRLEAERGRSAASLAHFKSAVHADRGFVPAAVALGDAQEHAGDLRAAVRTWERAAEAEPALALLGRLERVYRNDDRPRRMIALYRAACERQPDNLAVAVGLGRVYFELEMLDEAAEQFEKVEVRAPDMPIVHAFLAATFERRGETREAFEEYRRALSLAHGFEWPHACAACGAGGMAWEDRCPRCLRLDALRPVGPT
jgi:tetratricopeptide (TPR) repeat protein